MVQGPEEDGASVHLAPFWNEAKVAPDRLPYLEFQARRYGPIARFLGPWGPWAGRTVLDLGGGIGSLAVYLRARLGGEYHVADFFAPDDGVRRALAAHGVSQCFPSDLTHPDPLEGVPGSYDAILFVEVLEHLLVNPVRLFRALALHLSPGGLLFLTTPNQARLTNRRRLLLGRSIKDEGRYPVGPPEVYGHVIEYTRSELDRVMHYAGFDPVAHRIVQQIPTVRPSTVERWGVRLLNSGWASRAELGDDVLALYRKSAGGAPPTPPGGRV